jgi:hypothetical protein
VFISHPTSWYLLGPASLLLGSSCLVAFDAMAEEMGVHRAHRLLLSVMEAVVIFQVVTIWGHPEDLLAVGLALYALLAMFRQKWTASGWLWGAAIVVQPLVILAFPLAFVRTPPNRRIRLCVFSAVPTLVLVGTPLLSQWSATSKVLFRQQNFEFLDHATPWVALSPHLSKISVGAGPGRATAIVVAVAVAVVAARRPPSATGLLWLCALALSLRCCFEAVMVSFYLGPPLATIVMVAAFRNSWWRMVGAGTVAMVATWIAFHRLSPWGYWTPMVVLLATGLLICWPGRDALGWSNRASSDVTPDVVRATKGSLTPGGRQREARLEPADH